MVARFSGLETLEVGLWLGAWWGPDLDTFVDRGSVTEDSKMHDQHVSAQLPEVTTGSATGPFVTKSLAG